MRNSDVTKETILKASGLLFNLQGYKATSISDITQATGYTKGAIYRHFKSKEELEKEAFFYLVAFMFERMRTLIKAERTAGNKLRAVLRFFESYVKDYPIKGGCPLLNAAIEVDDSNEALREEATRTLKVLKDSVVHILKKGIEKEQIKEGTDVNFYATVMLASLEGAIMMSKLRRNEEDMRMVLIHLEAQIASIES